jgi:hypothetical protein
MDETTVPVAAVIAEAAYAQGVPPTLMMVPTSAQRAIPATYQLSLISEEAVQRQARAVLTCVNGDHACLPFREQILAMQNARLRIGHMPGASMQVLQLVNVDYDQLVADCHDVAFALSRGRRLTLTSYDAGGQAHVLRANLGGWERPAVASDGIIRDGAWGNVPSGEAYIAPIEGRAEGRVVINGSVPDRPLGPGEELVLTFEAGRLVKIDPSDSELARWLDRSEFQDAKAAGDPNWSNLAEVGIGVNPAVESLTGNMLFDEKAAGTAHIALGSNTSMGGATTSIIHCDLVTVAPTVMVDQQTLIDRGKLVFVDEIWREDHEAVDLATSPLKKTTSVRRTGILGEIENGYLVRVLHPDTGRLLKCVVGQPATARHAAEIYRALATNGDTFEVAMLAAQTDLNEMTVRRVLDVMLRYDLIQF